MTLRTDAEAVIKNWLMDCQSHSVNGCLYHAVSQVDIEVVLDQLEELAKSRLECFKQRDGYNELQSSERQEAAQMLRQLAAILTKRHFNVDQKIRQLVSGDLTPLLMAAAGDTGFDGDLAVELAQAAALTRTAKHAIGLAEKLETMLTAVDVPASRC